MAIAGENGRHLPTASAEGSTNDGGGADSKRPRRNHVGKSPSPDNSHHMEPKRKRRPPHADDSELRGRKICSVCKKPGHNAATCKERKTMTEKKPA